MLTLRKLRIHGLLLVGLIALLLLAPTAGARGQTKATLTLIKLAPLTLRGAHFKPAERVKLILQQAAKRSVRIVRAGPTGGFRLVFQGTTVDRCTSYTITARGNNGSAVTLKPKPQCPPA